MKIRPINSPIYQTSSFYFDSLSQAEDIFTLKQRNYIYSRGGNPTVNLLEKKMAELEKGVGAVCFSSGMGAICGVLMSLLKSGDGLVISDMLYGSTSGLAKEIMGKYGVQTYETDLSFSSKLERLLKTGSIRVIFFETPSNPTLKLVDIKKISTMAHKYGVSVVVDNTIATPYGQNPLTLGADVVVHSLSKYMGGHEDVLGGVAVAKDQDYVDKLKFGYMCHIGSVMDANTAFLIMRGIKTAQIRLKQYEDTASKVAHFLEKQTKVGKVIYPGLGSYEWRKVAKKQICTTGAIVSFYLKNSECQKIEKFMTSLKRFKLAVSFGGTDSLVEYPLYMTHRAYLKDENTNGYIDLKGLIRLSIGMDDACNLIDDLKEALDAI